MAACAELTCSLSQRCADIVWPSRAVLSPEAGSAVPQQPGRACFWISVACESRNARPSRVLLHGTGRSCAVSALVVSTHLLDPKAALLHIVRAARCVVRGRGLRTDA